MVRIANLADHASWLAGLYVDPPWRWQGVARLLVERVVQQAALMGINWLYLYTDTARGLYQKLGWRIIAHAHYNGGPVVIMVRAVDLHHSD